MQDLLKEFGYKKFGLECCDILGDDDVLKYERCLWRLKPECEPIVKQSEKNFCQRCCNDMLLNETESIAVCILCGSVKPVFVFKQNFKDMTYERVGYCYKRITHFRKHFRELQKKIGNLRIDHYIDRAELMFKVTEPLFRKYKPKNRRKIK
jgi:hypothetical protein